jgi:hypothetical protein
MNEWMIRPNRTRACAAAALAALLFAGCGTNDAGPPPRKQQVTIHVKEMGWRLKLD